MRVARADGRVCNDERLQMEEILVDHARISAEHAVLVTEIACHRAQLADCANAYAISRELRAGFDVDRRTPSSVFSSPSPTPTAVSGRRTPRIVQIAGELGSTPRGLQSRVVHPRQSHREASISTPLAWVAHPCPWCFKASDEAPQRDELRRTAAAHYLYPWSLLLTVIADVAGNRNNAERNQVSSFACVARGRRIMTWNYSKKTTELFMDAVSGQPGTHLGEIEDADGFGEHGSIACGDALRFTFRVDRHPTDPDQGRDHRGPLPDLRLHLGHRRLRGPVRHHRGGRLHADRGPEDHQPGHRQVPRRAAPGRRSTAR